MNEVSASNAFLIGCGSAAQHLAQTESATPQQMGFKAFNLLRMADVGLPVPPAFVLSTGYCHSEATRQRAVDLATWMPPLRSLEDACGLRLGDVRQPLLLSVRSGAPVSMPGMMETLLNIGLCDATLPGLLRLSGNPRMVWDAYRRLVATYGEVVKGLAGELFEREVELACAGRDERELDFAELRTLTRRFQALYLQNAGEPFPQDPHVQLAQAIAAVLRSWHSAKAVEYRRVNQLSEDMGTAVTVQTMVFGNAGGRSGAGVGFTRNPATGEPHPWVDFLFNAQGEDVVSGRRSAHGSDELATVLPEVWGNLCEATRTLERHFKDMQDFEFTVQDGRMYMLQTRHGKRTPLAAARIALDMLDEGLIDTETTLQRTAELDAASLSHRVVIAPDGQPLRPAATAPSACSGVVSGEVALDSQRAKQRQASGASIVLVRRDAETSDIQALEAAVGLLTHRGARTSHAAVVARQLGKVCLVGCEALQIDEQSRAIRIGQECVTEGALITLDGNDGAVYIGTAQTAMVQPTELISRLDSLRGLGHATS